MPRRIGYALIVLLGMACASPAAWAGKVGPEFLINTSTQGYQTFPSVAALSNGGFVVTWTSLGGGSGPGIYGQRYTAAGARVGGEFKVNTFRLNQDSGPKVAALSKGGFIVIWNSRRHQFDYGVYGQRFRADGSRIGREFQVNTRTAKDQDSPSVATLTDGGFVVTWRSDGQDGSFDGVYAQRYSASGARVGSEFQVNTYTTNDQSYPSVAGLSNGGFVFAWESAFQAGSYEDIYGQRYTAEGARVGPEFLVNKKRPFPNNAQIDPSVAALSKGGFVVTWESLGPDGYGYGIYGQLYGADGARVGGEFRVNATRVGWQLSPSVAALDDGRFVITWKSRGQDGSGYGIYGQRYNAAGARVGGEFRVNTTTVNAQHSPSVAPLSNGGFVVTWVSTGQDGSGSGIYGQLFEP